ncbi:hypothetical protein LSH36_279g00056 [Paralvinella palmiformis]|uniref:Uncharacterized protein n=1 Tax=Paralvinella palmiformis TaxID=53620 RepID=A0AAD9N1S8_9ANNE|nr:hypothetical protein LSH36_279g00056 [Paralvinella palmiformis]
MYIFPVSAPATVVPNTIKVSPDRGPRAGGTNLTLFTLADITIYIDVVTLKITAEIYKYCNVLLSLSSNNSSFAEMPLT